jgi:hypothetical protein
MEWNGNIADLINIKEKSNNVLYKKEKKNVL